MVVSNSICSIPFLSSTDTTRLQMASKQMCQATTSPNCRRPYVIGSDYHNLVKSTKMFRKIAEFDGNIEYINNDIAIITGRNGLHVLEIGKILNVQSFVTRLSYIRQVGPFKKGDVLYEYDCFIDGVPTYGYNVNTMFMSFFGMNYEDAFVISESMAKTCVSTKTETIIIPIYTYSAFNNIYNNRFGFIPDVGEKISNKTVYQLLDPARISDISGSILGEFRNGSLMVKTKLTDAKVYSIKINRAKNLKVVDPKFNNVLETMYSEYISDLNVIGGDIESKFGFDFAKNISQRYYYEKDLKRFDFDTTSLAYIIELVLIQDVPTEKGSKFANRYANKGVVSLIIPDDLRPINLTNGIPIDLILTPMSVYSRMNFGQLLEVMISKAVQQSETNILQDKTCIKSEIEKLSSIIEFSEDKLYLNSINDLSQAIDRDPSLQTDFYNSVKKGGLFIEMPGFTKMDSKKLKHVIKNKFNVSPTDSIMIKKETYEYMSDMFDESFPIPQRDMVFDNIFNGPMYILKLMQIAEYKLTARDFGEYKQSNKQPSKNKIGDGSSSRIGNMEFEALMTNNSIQVLNEFRTLKSDSSETAKEHLMMSVLSTDKYNLQQTEEKSYTRLMIDSLLTFVNNA